METFIVIMDLLGDVAMLFIAITISMWGSLILKAISDAEKRSLEMWGRHYEFEQVKAKAFVERLRSEPAPEPEDVN